MFTFSDKSLEHCQVYTAVLMFNPERGLQPYYSWSNDTRCQNWLDVFLTDEGFTAVTSQPVIETYLLVQRAYMHLFDLEWIPLYSTVCI